MTSLEFKRVALMADVEILPGRVVRLRSRVDDLERNGLAYHDEQVPDHDRRIRALEASGHNSVTSASHRGPGTHPQTPAQQITDKA